MNWITKSLSDIATIAAGQSAPQREEDFSDVGIPFIRAGHLTDLSLGMPESSLKRVAEVNASSYGLKIFPKGTVLFAKSGMSCMKGVVYQLKNDAYVVNHLACVMPKDVDGRFLEYFFKVNKPNKLIRDEAYPSIRLSDISQMLIPLPPLDIQRQIAAALDKAQSLIAIRREQIAILDKLARDLFVDMFGDPVENSNGWDVKALPEFYKGGKQAIKCGPFGSALKKDEYTETGVAVWTMDNITKLGEFIDNPYLRIPVAKYKQLASYGVMNGDVIISRAGTVGKMCVVDSVEPDSIISTNLIRARFNEKFLLPQYFVSLILCYGAKVARLRKGADNAFSHMNTGILDSIAFPYPPMELQRDYKRRLDRISKQKADLIESLLILENIYKSLLQQAFNGELFQ